MYNITLIFHQGQTHHWKVNIYSYKYSAFNLRSLINDLEYKKNVFIVTIVFTGAMYICFEGGKNVIQDCTWQQTDIG